MIKSTRTLKNSLLDLPHHLVILTGEGVSFIPNKYSRLILITGQFEKPWPKITM